MIIEEIRNIKSGKKQLRQFGITLGVILGLLGGLFILRQRNYYHFLFVLSGIFFALGLISPMLLKPVQKIWMSLAVIMGWFVTRVILIVLFYVVVTPTAILARVFGKDFLNTRLNRNSDSYWIAKEAVQLDRSRYENQF